MSVYIRPQRYTKEFIDREKLFTVCAFDNKYKKALGYMGSHSGRDGDKAAKAGLTPVFAEGTSINLYYGAPLVLFVCYDKDACWTHPQSGKSSGATDATIVTTHMMLEAVSIGLGTVWISYFDEDKAKELLNLPSGWQPLCMLYVGYPASDFVPNTKLGCHRKPLNETCFYNEVPEGVAEK